MKIFVKALIIISIIIHGCEVKKNGLNQFSSSTDTLVVRTEKHKDRGPFLSSHVQVTFENMTKESMKDFLFPSGISKIKAIHLFTDFADEDPNYVDIISGILENEKIFIVDENNNNNFRDDSIRTIKRLKWDSPEGLIKCKYLISNSQEIVEDSSWIQIREDQNILWLGIKEHLTADLNIDNKEFRLGITDLFSGNFTYGTRSWIALLSDNNITKDTLLERDILAIGEVLKLGQNHYRFEDITNNGEYITLIKEKDFYNKVGIQVGMIAPDFTCISVSGDTIRSSTLHDRIMVIANSCGCGGDKESTEAYYQILNKFGDKIHILHLDSKIDKSLEDYHIDMEEDFNKDIYRKYRNEYCSRTCFVIDNNNRIIDRFPIKDWKQYLPNLIDY